MSCFPCMDDVLHYPASEAAIDEEAFLLLLLRGLESIGEGDEWPELRAGGCVLFHNNIYLLPWVGRVANIGLSESGGGQDAS